MNIKEFCDSIKIKEKDLNTVIYNSPTVLQFHKMLIDNGIIIKYEDSANLYYKDLK